MSSPPDDCRFALVLHVHGVRVGVRAAEEALLHEFRATEVPRHWREADSGEADHWFSLRLEDGTGEVWQDGQRIQAPPGRGWAVRTLGNRLHVCVAEHADPEVFVHAAAVEVGGRAVLIPGRSYAGKSSLTLALCRKGAALLSDDFAVLDHQGRVRDYPLPLSRRVPQGEPVLIPPEDLGWQAGGSAVPVGMVVLTRWRDSATFDPRELTAGEAALGLFGHAVAARRDPARVMEALARAAEGARSYEGDRGEADRAAEWILERLG